MPVPDEVPEGTDPDQWWFWTEQWQAGEREVDEQIANGEGTYYDNAEEMLAAWGEHRNDESAGEW